MLIQGKKITITFLIFKFKFRFKLATCYLNAKFAVKAINICNEIKKKFKDYPIDELTISAKNLLLSG